MKWLLDLREPLLDLWWVIENVPLLQAQSK